MGAHSSFINHVNMAEEEETLAPVDVDHEDDLNYQPPPEKSIDELTLLDKDDESLQKYKAALLGGAVAGSGRKRRCHYRSYRGLKSHQIKIFHPERRSQVQ